MEVKELLNNHGKQYHIDCSSDDVGRYVLLPGDPLRTDRIAEYLNDARMVAHNREHRTWTGTLDGVKVSVTSTGMGGPSTAIAVEELIHCGADTFIRVGTCGRLCPESFDVNLEGVIATAAVRDEGTTLHYIPAEYPAVADHGLTADLICACRGKNRKFVQGIVQSKDAFYGQYDPNGLPDAARLHQRWAAWEAGNVMASEMEMSTLFVIASIRKARAAGILSYKEMSDSAIQIALDALRLTIARDCRNVL